MVEQVKDDDLELGLVVFGKADPTFNIPQPEVLVESFGQSGKQRVGHVVSDEQFSVLRSQKQTKVRLLLVEVVVEVLLKAGIDYRIGTCLLYTSDAADE